MNARTLLFLLFSSLAASAMDIASVSLAPTGTDASAPRPLEVTPIRVGFRTMTNACFTTFTVPGKPVDVLVRPASPFRSVALRPENAAAQVVDTSADTVRIRVSAPGPVSVEFDGDSFSCLHLLANPPERDVPPTDAPGVLFFGPGLHAFGTDERIASGGTTNDGKALPRSSLKVPSNTTVYLAEGAVLQAGIAVERGATNVVIRGRGIIDLSPWNQPDGRTKWGKTHHAVGINLDRAKHVRVEGVVIKQPCGYGILGGMAEDVGIENVKIFSSHIWADGIDMMSSSRISIRDCLIRTTDDCIAVYGSRFSFRGDSRDWLVERCVLWADGAHPVYIGVHGDYKGDGDTLERLVFRDLDILESNERNPAFQGALSIGCGDKNTCRDIRFEDIRVARVLEGGRLIDLQFKFFEPSTVPGRSIENVVFRNISCAPRVPTVIAGKSEEQRIRGVVLENVTVAGEPLAAGPLLKVGRFAEVAVRP